MTQIRAKFEALQHMRSRRYHALTANIEVDFDTGVPTKLFSRDWRMRKSNTPNSDAASSTTFLYETKLSYIRANKHLCIMLVDRLPPSGRRSRLRCESVFTKDWILLPRLFGSDHAAHQNHGGRSIYKALQSCARHPWLRQVLCGEQRLASQSIATTSVRSTDEADSPAWAACDPQGLLYLLSSSIWEMNLRTLTSNIRDISFDAIPQASSADQSLTTNTILHEHRSQLELLKMEVTDVDAQIPQGLQQYYDLFPRIRRRGKAKYLSLVENYESILNRAKNLDKVLIDSFQILM
ncbi:hypothetical protein LTR95_014626, partial [Oleoguttula sp. CCFEE 5521]